MNNDLRKRRVQKTLSLHYSRFYLIARCIDSLFRRKIPENRSSAAPVEKVGLKVLPEATHLAGRVALTREEAAIIEAAFKKAEAEILASPAAINERFRIAAMWKAREQGIRIGPLRPPPRARAQRARAATHHPRRQSSYQNRRTLNRLEQCRVRIPPTGIPSGRGTSSTSYFADFFRQASRNAAS